MARENRLLKYKLPLFSLFFFLMGCMFTVNVIPIDKTCKLEKRDREFNIMNDAKLKSPDLIVLILSAPRNFAKRNTIRETWLKLKNPNDADYNINFKHFFVIGGLNLSAETSKAVNYEQLKHNDVLILPMRDNYKNLTLKVLKSFAWLQSQYEFGVDFKYVLKCDDDSFVRIDSLTHELGHIELIYLKSDFEDLKLINDNTSPYLRVDWQVNYPAETRNENLGLYWGYFNGNAKVKTAGKWKEDSWILCDNYLPYALGGGYILSKRLVSFLAQNAEYLRQYNSEDISVGVWLAAVKNVLRIHDRRFDTEWTTRGCQNYYLITHSVSQQQMRVLYGNLIEKKNLCAKEELKRHFYMYNWTTAPSNCCSRNMKT